MFTGLVEQMVAVAAIDDRPPGKRFVIPNPFPPGEIALGESIAVNGCCLTVVSHAAARLEFDAGEETLSRTNLGRLVVGSPVNLERSLRLQDRLGGHLVTGHIDAVGHLESRTDDAGWSHVWFRTPPHLSRQMASKGSIAVDGVSLTLVQVELGRFSVALIPHTLERTTLGELRPGDPVNLETDLLAKYVESQLRSDWKPEKRP